MEDKILKLIVFRSSCKQKLRSICLLWFYFLLFFLHEMFFTNIEIDLKEPLW